MTFFDLAQGFGGGILLGGGLLHLMAEAYVFDFKYLQIAEKRLRQRYQK
jgi:hypothetical protein